MKKISIESLQLEPFRMLDQDWALLVAGTSRPNPMTVSWGGFGTLWNLPVCTVFVRPTRHTFACLLESAAFTLNFMPDDRRQALDICGQFSGRDCDKWKEAGIDPIASETIAVPRVSGAILSFECRLVGSADIDPSRFLDRGIDKMYPDKDYHRVFWGHVLAAWQK